MRGEKYAVKMCAEIDPAFPKKKGRIALRSAKTGLWDKDMSGLTAFPERPIG